jgi:4-methylaminobutanoate oxidase (formaldehyde-forming)
MIRRIGDGEDVAVSDATEDYAYINLQGPKSRELMQAVTGKNMDDDAFPFRAAKEIEVAGENFRAVRITYVGELGYELYVPADRALAVYDKIIQAGKDFGLAHVGLKALGSLRLEKGYRDYGHDLDNLDTLVEAGLGFTADMKKEGGFIGKEKVVEERARNKERGGMTKRMVSVVCEDSICYLHHGEVLTVDGVEVGEVRAGSQGFSVGGAVGLVMVEHPDGEIINKKLVENGKWEVKVANRIYDCRVSLGPPYDPKNVKIKG